MASGCVVDNMLQYHGVVFDYFIEFPWVALCLVRFRCLINEFNVSYGVMMTSSDEITVRDIRVRS